MKIAHYTPGLTASAIGASAALVTRGLIAAGHDVTVVRTEHASSLAEPAHDFGCEVLNHNDADAVRAMRKHADVSLYQIGNNYSFHQGALRWMRSRPGIVILHDFFLGHLFLGWARWHEKEAEREIRRWHPDWTLKKFYRLAARPDFIQDTHDVAPMTEWIASQALGVLTHSTWGCDRVLRSCPGPVVVAPLAYQSKYESGAAPEMSPDARRFRVLTVGHVNENKRAEAVIRAIGGSKDLRDRTTYHLAGLVEPARVLQLSALARQCGVDLVISGEVSDAALATAIQDSDVISCLRWPCLEAASASMIEAMLAGKPVLVTDAGSYAEIPADVVVKVSHDSEVADVRAGLSLLARDLDFRTQLAQRARDWAIETYRVEKYVQGVLDLSEHVLGLGPSIKANAFFVEECAKWDSCGDPALVEPIRTGIIGGNTR